MCATPHRCGRRKRGTSLFEALIAFLVLSMAALATARWTAPVRAEAEIARQRSEAVRLAQAGIERLRSFTALQTPSGGRAVADITDADDTIEIGATSFRVRHETQPLAGDRARSVSITVHWTDRQGNPQRVVLDTLIAAADPVLGGALALARGTP
jgi:Tfp pilus assembly protein PilV